MKLTDCNPYIRSAELQPAILERTGLRKAYDYRLFYILENSGIIIIDGIYHQVCPDTVIVIPPATGYDFQGTLKTGVLNFDVTRNFSHRSLPLFPPRVVEFDPGSLFETELLEGFETPRLLQGDFSTRELVLRIISQFNSRGKYADTITSSLLKLLFGELLSRSTSSEDLLIGKIMSYIHTNAASIGSNSDVAQVFGYHPVYLNSLIKRATGKTLHAVITEEKIKIACQWLGETDRKIDDITHLAGFHSRPHFCSLFKKELGISPAEYRTAHVKSVYLK